MNQEYLSTVLLGPIVSEKSTRIGDQSNQVVFKVKPRARKMEIKRAVETMFEVEVASVNVANMRGKRKGMGRIRGKRSDWKKAYVRLREGHDIDFLGAE
ncbi:MAG: 50S ribosomal protein L23 [Gammaproteobacteria bacterium]|nr:50S ribosomal protein L23 [Gammaproteobacteria bacterium]